MFEGFASVWTPVGFARDLPRGKLWPVTVAGTQVVLFREADGRVRALVDRCPHRGVALSLGRIAEDGCVECPFHGWRFDGAGAVRSVPWNPDARCETLGAQPVPALERGELLWIYTAPGVAAPVEPSLDEAFLAPGQRCSGEVIEWSTHWTRAMENMLDWPHLPFVHRGTIGRGQRDKVHTGRMDVRWEPTPWGATSHIEIDGVKQDGRLDLRWPNRMNLYVSFGSSGRGMAMEVACVPVDATRTRMVLATHRTFLTARLFDGLFRRMNRRIANEDKAILESSFPAEVPRASDEQSVRTDALTLHFRKRYFAELRASRGEPAGARRGLRVLSAAESA